MTSKDHADRTEKLLGERAEDIHRWIDGMFDVEGFADFLRRGPRPGYDPYAHRRHRHCREALAEVRKEFTALYPRSVIDAVFEQHIRDDYDGYFPWREDFASGTFKEKYHEAAGPQADPDPSDLAEYFRGRHYEQAALAARRRGRRFLRRFVAPVAASILLLTGSLFTVIVPISRDNMMTDKGEMIRELTAVALGAVDHYASRAMEGEMSLREAQAEALEEIRRMRYGAEGRDYFWIIDSGPVMVMHPYQPELEGLSMADYRDREDTDGIFLFAEAARIAAGDGEGTLRYYWQHWDDPGAKALKLSYFRLHEDWNWIVGTGVYIEDVEEDLQRLTTSLLWVFGGIASVSVLLLLWVLRGANRIERQRESAVEGLKEAKERYRALAEASTEGYLLIIGGKILYANAALSRMLGFSEDELAARSPADLLDSSVPQDHPCRCALESLGDSETPGGSWSVSLKRKGGTPLPFRVSLSRIFLTGSNGHLLAVRRPAAPRDGAALEPNPVFPEAIGLSATEDGIVLGIRRSTHTAEALAQAGELGRNAMAQLARGASSTSLRGKIAETYHTLLETLVGLALETRSPAPCLWSFLSLGSNARGEMTLFSDQDSAIVFDSPPGENPENLRRWFLSVAAEVVDGLESAGFPRCRGGVMALNPRWCLSLEEWKDRIQSWIQAPTPQALLEVHVALDRKRSAGDEKPARGLEQVFRTMPVQTGPFPSHLSHHAVAVQGPRIRRGRSGTVDLKEALKPIEAPLRVLSVRHGIAAVGTLDRLKALAEAGVVNPLDAEDLRLAFETLWDLRFRRQLDARRQLERIDESLDIATLSPLGRERLVSAMRAIENFRGRQAAETARRYPV